MSNPFTTRDEVIFCTLEDMLISSRSGVLKQIIEKGIPEFDHCIEKGKYDGLNEKNIVRLAVTSRYYNPVCELVTDDILAVDEGRYDDGEEDFENDIILTDAIETVVRADMPNLYMLSPKTDLAYGALNLLANPSLTTFIIYTEDYDIRVNDIINEIYSSFTSKIIYVYGEFGAIIEKLVSEGIKPTSYILNDIDMAKYLFDSGEEHTKFIEVMVGNLGYNYIMNELNDMFELKHDFPVDEQQEKCIKFSLMNTFNLSEEYFTGDDIIETTIHSVEEMADEEMTEEEREVLTNVMRKSFDEIDKYDGYKENMMTDNDGTIINLNKSYDKL